MPITLAPIDTSLKVIKVSTDPKIKKYLESIGIVVNATIKVLSNTSGNVILEIKESRLALDRNVAATIFVS